MKYLIHLLIILLPSISFAFDSSNAGTYAVVHKDGHVTNFHFQVSQKSGTWNVMQRRDNGTWKNVTCERDCILHISAKSEINNFVPQDVLANYTYECIHNSAFAFCAYGPTGNINKDNYVLIALVTKRPTPVYLKKLE